MKSKSFKCVVIGCRMKEKNVDQAWGKKLRIPLHWYVRSIINSF